MWDMIVLAPDHCLSFYFVSRTVWNTNDDRCSFFSHFLKIWKHLYTESLYIEMFPHVLILPIFRKCGNVSI